MATRKGIVNPIGVVQMIKPKLVCQVEFVEWTDAGHLRHCTFIAIPDDKEPAEVARKLERFNRPAAYQQLPVHTAPSRDVFL